MASTPKFKVYDATGTYQGSAKEVAAASVLAGFYGAGSTVRIDHSPAWTVWTAGENDRASYDEIAAISWDRELAMHMKVRERFARQQSKATA